MIDVTKHDLMTILSILDKYVPECEVRAFGSRVTWTTKDHSDLDLVVVGPDKIDRKRMGDIQAALEESALPFSVDLMDWHRISEQFHRNIEKNSHVIKSPVVKTASSWPSYKVSEFAEVIGGGIPKTGVAEYWNGNIPWITPKDLSSHQGRYIVRGERNLTEEGLKNSSARLVPANTVLLTSRAPVGYLAIAQNPVTTNQGFRSLVVKDGFSPEFIYYLLLHNVEYLKQHASGSTFQELSGGTLKNLQFCIPDLNIQKKIAKVLSDLDAKIELNQQMNKTLEAMAQALFKRWFDDFEFPGHEKVKFIDDQPEGWRSSEFGEIVSCVRNQVQPGEHLSNRNYVPIECMPMNQVCLSEYKSYAEAQSSLITFEKGDILFGAMRAYFHRVNYAPFAGITRTTVFVLRPKKEHWLSYALCLMNLSESVEYANAHSRGSTMPYAVWDNSPEKMPVVFPPDDILIEFDKIIRPFIDAMNGNAEIIRGLTQIRDSLLPKLMTGEATV